MLHRKALKCNFAIVFEARTGSSYVVSALNRHSKILCYTEMLPHLDAEGQSRAVKAFLDGQPVEEIARWAFNWDFFSRHPDEKEKPFAAGFKTRLEYVCQPSSLKAALENAGVRLIRLRRDNIVKLAVSMVRAERLAAERGRWNVPLGDKVLEAYPIPQETFDRALRERSAEAAACDVFANEFKGEVLHLSYEDLLRDHDQFFSKIFQFLEVPEEPVSGMFKKNTEDDLRKVVSNLDELAEAYRGTPFHGKFFE